MGGVWGWRVGTLSHGTPGHTGTLLGISPMAVTVKCVPSLGHTVGTLCRSVTHLITLC